MKKHITILSTVLFSLFIIGCYTTFKHPHVEEMVVEDEEYVDYHVTHMDDCAQCHINEHALVQSDYNLYDDHEYDSYNSYNWDFYYDSPWWSAPVYYSSSPGVGGESLPPTQKRGYQRRETSGNVSSSSPSSTQSSVSKSTATSGSSSQSNASSSGKRTAQRRDTSTETKSKTRRDTSTAPKAKKDNN